VVDNAAEYLVNGLPATSLPLADRALNYGDGVFETILVTNHHYVMWDQHLTRLLCGVERLQLPYQSASGLKARVQALVDRYQNARSDGGSQTAGHVFSCVVKIIISRGVGGRGYSPRECNQANEIIACLPWSGVDPDYYIHGIPLRILLTPVVSCSALAGIKHLNRLEQVLASAELKTTEFEGLMCDEQGWLVEGTKSNILLKQQQQQRWITPVMTQSGVRGVLREYLLSHGRSLGIQVEEIQIHRSDYHTLAAAAIINSVFGVIPVCSIEDQHLDVACVVDDIQKPIHQIFSF